MMNHINVEKKELREDYFEELYQWSLMMECSQCGSFGEDEFNYVSSCSNFEEWECKSCKYVISNFHRPKEDDYIFNPKTLKRLEKTIEDLREDRINNSLSLNKSEQLIKELKRENEKLSNELKVVKRENYNLKRESSTSENYKEDYERIRLEFEHKSIDYDNLNTDYKRVLNEYNKLKLEKSLNAMMIKYNK